MDYRQLVRATAERYGLDPNLAEAVMAQESGGRPNAVSPVGATGLMQLMPGTAKELGVDPSDPVQNVDGGVRYLKQQIDKFGVAGGLAAYNAGPGRVQKSGGQFNALPEETRNYVPSVMNRTAEIAQRGGANVAQPQQPQTPDLPTLLGGFEKARAANDTEAVNEIGGLVRSKFDSALAAARAANDAEAVKEIEGAMSKYGFGAQATPATPGVAQQVTPAQATQPTPQAPSPTPPKPEKKTSFLQDVGLGAADALSFGFADEAYAKAASALRGTNYEDELKTARETIDQAGPGKYVGMGASFLVPGVGVVRAANTASKLARVGAGAATGATQGALYGAGSAEGDLADRAQGAAIGAGTGAVLGGALTGVIPTTVKEEANRFIRQAGSNRTASMDAEVAKRIGEVADDPARFFKGSAPQSLNAQTLNAAVTKSFLEPVKDALASIPKGAQPANIKELRNALQNWKGLSEAQRDALRGTQYGDAVADAIEKAVRSQVITSAKPATGGIVGTVGRTAVEAAPSLLSAGTGVPVIVGTGLLRGISQKLGGRQSREEVSSALLDPKARKTVDEVLQRLGPSAATQSLQGVQQMAQRAQSQAQARAQAQAQAKAAQAAQNQATRIGVLQQTRRPLSGGFQELLPGGRANTNLSSGQAIDALRLLKRQGGPVGDAADQILKSKPVTNQDAFYGLQNALRGLQERGVVQGAPQAGGALSSGIRNPVSYAEAVRTAGEAADLARQAAPNKALAQFATKIAGTKAPSDKVSLLQDRLSKTTDPAEISYLTQFVEPLTRFGAK